MKKTHESKTSASILEIGSKEVETYSIFFERVLGNLPYYDDEERSTAIAAHQPAILRRWIEEAGGFILGIHDSHGVLIATIEGQIVRSKVRDVNVGCINWVLVDEKMRRNGGLGSRLYTEVERRFRAAHCVEVIASVKKSNLASVAFHTRHSYGPSTIKHRRDDAVILIKRYPAPEEKAEE